MGRLSNRKAQRRSGQRQPTVKEVNRSAVKANRRARRVGDSVEDFERVTNLGVDRLVEALISRYTIRMDNVSLLPDYFRVECLGVLCPIVGIDHALRKMGVPLLRLPSRFHGGWLTQLSWGVDSAVAACRLLLVGQFAGAATIARQQLELWTLLYASSANIAQRDEESVQIFIARVWTEFAAHGWSVSDIQESSPQSDLGIGESETTTDELEVDHSHVDIGEGRLVCPAAIYGYLSEYIHADFAEESIPWETADRLNERDIPDSAIIPIRIVEESIALCMLHIRMITAALAIAAQKSDLAHRVLEAPVRFSRNDECDPEGPHPLQALGRKPTPKPIEPVTPNIHCLMPLMPSEGLRPDVVNTLENMNDAYERALLGGRRIAGRLYRDDEAITLIFASHRMSSVLAAKFALASEERELGSSFNIEGLDARGTQFVLVTEFSAMCARWGSENEKMAAALAMVSSSLRTAFWLWLEDDDRAMALLRCTLEQIARVRVWHKKPERAETMESDSATTPRDWLNRAGWRRLAALNRAFGEFSHAHTNPRWDGARLLLAELQTDNASPTAQQTGRRAALELIATLVARTCTELAEDEFSRPVGSAAREIFKRCGMNMTPGDRELDSILDHVWTYRSHPLVTTPFPRTRFPIGQEGEASEQPSRESDVGT